MLIGQGVTFLINASFATLCIYLYGDELSVSVLDNINMDKNVYNTIIQIAFVSVIAFVSPFYFFITKEALLITVDELINKSMSKEL